MRIGKNPAKESIQIEFKYYHRIIIPVYIPNLDGYFKDTEKILRMCIDSIIRTIHSKACITIVNNASCEPVRALLDKYYRDGHIDQLVHFADNKGKVDAIYSVAKGCYEPLITITDSDVLFLPGWIEEVEKAFQSFPEIGLISPCPIPSLWNYKSSSSLLMSLLSFRLKTKSLVPKEDLLKFPKSVNNPKLYEGKEMLLEKQLAISRNGSNIIVGAGHFVATLRREVFKAAPDRPALRKIIGNSEREYIDVPVDRIGLLRVSTPRVLAHHLGNTFEDWMQIEFQKHAQFPTANPVEHIPPVKKPLTSYVPYLIRDKFAIAMVSRPLRRAIFSIFGVGAKGDFKS